MTKAEKQANFRDDVDTLRRKLEKSGHVYGNVTYQRIDKARRSNLLALRGLGVEALPPEVSAVSRPLNCVLRMRSTMPRWSHCVRLSGTTANRQTDRQTDGFPSDCLPLKFSRRSQR